MTRADLRLRQFGAALGGQSAQGAGGPYTTTASDYDGTNDYASFLSGINGGVDTGADQGIMSFWVQVDADGVQYGLTDTAGVQGCLIERSTTADRLYFLFRSDSNILINVTTGQALTADGSFHHIFCAWDFTDATTTNNWFRAYFDGTKILDDTNVLQEPLNFSDALRIGARNSGGGKLNGCLSELYIQLGETLDPDVAGVLDKFRDSETGKPVSLGSDGSTPTGSQPRVYAPDGDPSTNLGTAGNATITGALTACASSPTD